MATSGEFFLYSPSADRTWSFIGRVERYSNDIIREVVEAHSFLELTNDEPAKATYLVKINVKMERWKQIIDRCPNALSFRHAHFLHAFPISGYFVTGAGRVMSVNLRDGSLAASHTLEIEIQCDSLPTHHMFDSQIPYEQFPGQGAE